MRQLPGWVHPDLHQPAPAAPKSASPHAPPPYAPAPYPCTGAQSARNRACTPGAPAPSGSEQSHPAPPRKYPPAQACDPDQNPGLSNAQSQAQSRDNPTNAESARSPESPDAPTSGCASPAPKSPGRASSTPWRTADHPHDQPPNEPANQRSPGQPPQRQPVQPDARGSPPARGQTRPLRRGCRSAPPGWEHPRTSSRSGWAWRSPRRHSSQKDEGASPPYTQQCPLQYQR